MRPLYLLAAGPDEMPSETPMGGKFKPYIFEIKL